MERRRGISRRGQKHDNRKLVTLVNHDPYFPGEGDFHLFEMSIKLRSFESLISL